MLGLAGPALRNGRAGATLVVLGVTPGVVHLDWPAAKLLAFDGTEGMIESHWRPHAHVPSAVACAMWDAMPVPDGAAAVVVGDGSLNALPSLAYYEPVLREVHRMLSPNGLLVLRCFVSPEGENTVQNVVDAVMSGEFANSAGYLFRLATAMADRDGYVTHGDLVGSFDTLFPNRQTLATAAGWQMSEIMLFDGEQGRTFRLTFPKESELIRLAAPFFEVRAIRRGSYPLAELCPTISFAPKRGA